MLGAISASMMLFAACATSTGSTMSGTRALRAAVDGDWRSAESKARDAARHPAESLRFWGLRPGMTILEVNPGAASWWTEILAPYARMTGGKFYATGADLDDPRVSESARKERAAFEEKYSNAELYGQVKVINWSATSVLPPANTFDFVLVSRAFHGWMRLGATDTYLKRVFDILKPGGILAIEQHRANPGAQDPKAPAGYVTEAYVVEQAEKAGFRLQAKSQVNANKRDTKDHPFGVWTLPPTRLTAPFGKPPDPTFDRSKYDAIGESDRMTLRFAKPN